MAIRYLVIGRDKFVDANKRLDVNFIDVDKRFVNVNEIANKLVIDIDKLVHANIVLSDWCRQVCRCQYINHYILTLSRPLPLSARLSNINCAFEFPLLLYCNISAYTDSSAVLKFFVVGGSNCTGWTSLSDTLSKLFGISEMKLKELRMTGINLREGGIYNTMK